MENSDKVGIIITNYNYKHYLKDSIESCMNQTYDNFIVIVVDDASTDGSLELIKTYFTRDGIFRYFPNKTNKGIGASKNAGIMTALINGCKYVTFCDADDILTLDSVDVRIRAMRKHKLEFVHAQAFKVDGKNKGVQGKPKSINAQTTMYDINIFKKYGLFYEPRELHSKEDTEMVWRLGLHYDTPLPKLVKVKKIKKPVAYHRYHEQSAKSGRTKEQKKSLQKAFDKRISILKMDGITKGNTRFLI